MYMENGVPPSVKKEEERPSRSKMFPHLISSKAKQAASGSQQETSSKAPEGSKATDYCERCHGPRCPICTCRGEKGKSE
jgi:hypothetical protein